jgi:hypothetical protein
MSDLETRKKAIKQAAEQVRAGSVWLRPATPIKEPAVAPVREAETTRATPPPKTQRT